MSTIKVERTGMVFSTTSSEYLVTFANGSTTTIWSPPWHDYSPTVEDAHALKVASEMWIGVCEAWERAAEDATP